MHVRSALIKRLGGLHPRVVDAGFAAGLAVLTCLAGDQYQPVEWRRFDALAYLLSCLICLPLAARRRTPMAALLVSGGAYAGYLAIGYPPSLGWWGPVLACYSVVAHGQRRTVLVGVVFTGALVIYSGLKAVVLPPSVIIAQPVLVLGAIWLVGTGARTLADRNRQLVALTARLRLEQRDRARRAIAEERVRIARELHDVVAHHLSVVSVQVGLAQYVFTSDPPTARAALDVIAEAGQDAKLEMHRLLSVLRLGGDDPERPGAPPPGLARLDEMVDRVRAAGLPVEVVVTGPRVPLPAHLDLCVYRVIQESLTNVLRHAGPARATVALRFGRDELVVGVTDTGRGRIDDTDDAPSGQGLIGMRERARLYDGTLSVGSGPYGGFEVRLTLPIRSEPA